MDARSKRGPWIQKVLSAIHNHPLTPAVVIASHTGFKKEWLKLHVCKLKNPGLTISHHAGYSLSPCGNIIFQQFGKNRSSASDIQATLNRFHLLQVRYYKSNTATAGGGTMSTPERVIELFGFDPEGEPRMRVQADGGLLVEVEFMPPSWVEDNPTSFEEFD